MSTTPATPAAPAATPAADAQTAAPAADAAAPAAAPAEPAAAPRPRMRVRPAPAAAAPAAPAPQPARGNGGLTTGLLVLVAALVLALAAALFYSTFGPSNGAKIGPNNRVVEAPATTTVLPPVADKAPQVGKVTVTPNGGIVVEGTNPDRSGIVQNVTVALPACNANCPPKVVTPPCQTGCVRPYVRPAPQVYRPAPAPQRVSSCFVQVDVQGPPSEIQIKDGSGRVVGRANVAGSGRVPVPCDFARAGRGQICLITGGVNAPARDLNPEWFSMAQGNLSRGNSLLNAGHPVWFRKG